MPRFVVLEHDQPTVHWDLLLEAGAVLRAWRLAEPPTPGSSVQAEPNVDHRPAYLDYEGPISGGRGHVCRYDSGSYQIVEETTTEVVFHFIGNRLDGRGTLSQDPAGNWTFSS